MSLKLNETFLSGFVSEQETEYLAPYAKVAHAQLVEGTGAGSDFHGWVRLPENYFNYVFCKVFLFRKNKVLTFFGFVV